MNRIQQDAIAESVGMTRDGLADVQRQQDYYRKLGATNLKQAQEELRILKEKGYTEKEINKMIGEDAYNYITQTSTAERLTEMMNRIKNTFVEFVQKSGILEFITNPQKIQSFAQSLINKLAGAVQVIGDIIATLIGAIGSLPFTDTAKWKGLASTVRQGTSGFASGLKGAASAIGTMNFGEAAPSVGTTVEKGTRQQATPSTSTGMTKVTGKETSSVEGRNFGDVYLDGQKVGYIVLGKNANNIYGLDKA
jgi:phage-related protein